MPIDPRTPVIVGVGQTLQRTADPGTAQEPVDLLADAARAALADAGASLRVDTVAIAEIISWRYPDPGPLLARRIDPKAWLDWTQADDAPCPNVVGDARPGTSQYEMAHRALAPTQVYPLFETAIRHASGNSVDGHQRRS